MSEQRTSERGDHRIGPRTERLELRQMSPDDAEAFFGLRSDPQVLRYTHEAPAESVAAARRALATYPDFDRIGYGRWGCYLKDTGELIGFSGLKWIEELGATDLGYRFLPEYWGRGYATESGRASLRYGFEEIGLERICGFVLPANAASIRVLEKLEFERDGVVDFAGMRVLRFTLECHDWREREDRA